MSLPSKHVYTFGDFRLLPADRLLFRNRQLIPLTPKVFDALVLLVENTGHLVEKEEFIKRLWPETFVGDDTLAQNISLLRKAVADEGGEHALIVTVPRCGYRFVGTVHEECEGEHGQATELFQRRQSATSDHEPAAPLSLPASRGASVEQSHLGLRETLGESLTSKTQTLSSVAPASHVVGVLRLRLGRVGFAGATLATGVLAGLLTYLALLPSRVPRVVRTTRITTSGRVEPWGRLVTDGTRIYFLEREGDHWNLMQTSVTGGESEKLTTPFRNARILDISPDGSAFLIAGFVVRGREMPLWIWPVQGGPPRRVGDVAAYDAAWCPDGRQIVYAKDDGVFLSDANGANAHKFAATTGQPFDFSWSPDGRLLRFTVLFQEHYGGGTWEINSDGTNLHPLFRESNTLSGECCGTWAPDARYYFFQSTHGDSVDIWTTREKRGLLLNRENSPSRLTAGPDSFFAPRVSKDGHKLYVFGWNPRSELIRYDVTSRQSAPLVASVTGWDAAYSPNGQWIAYAADKTLWRAKRDGSERLPLTSPPLDGMGPRWSPDGKQIAFTGLAAGTLNKIYLTSADGGPPKELIPEEVEQANASWSADGRFIAFSRSGGTLARGSASSGIEIFDFSANRAWFLSGSEGTRAPAWSPDGRFIAATTIDQDKAMLFDFRSRQWSELAQGRLISGLAWSRDGKSLYFQDLAEPNQPVYRLGLKDHKRQLVASFETLLHTGIQRCGFIGLTPEGALTLAVLRNHADIYALDLSIP